MAQYNTPQALRPLEKLICDFAYSNGYEPMSVFNDFLRYVTHGFSPGAPPVKDWKYKRQQNRFFMELFAGWIQLMQRELQTREWFDAFGDLFMTLSSRSGQQAHGQFFTPVHICDLMVQCTDTDEKTTGKRMNDPTCGSGRLHTGMNDFLDAYQESNYSSITDGDTSTLHNSCMRYEDKARNAADFYANFAGAGILVARDEGNNVIGRAVVWRKAVWNTTGMPAIQVSVLDRIYTSHAFVMDLIRKQAGSLGINLRKKYNDYTHPEDFISMSQIPGMAEEPGTEVHVRLSVKVPASGGTRKGFPIWIRSITST